MANTLLTRNQEESEKLVEELSHTILKSPTDFIAAYSEGWLNRNDDAIKEIAQRIVDVYQNVQFKGRDLIFVSQSEVMVDEIYDGLLPWKIITKLKRSLTDSFDENKYGKNVYFTFDNAGYIYVQEDGELVKLTNEKFFRNNEELKVIYSRYSSFAEDVPDPEDVSSDDSESVEEHDNSLPDVDGQYNPYLEDENEVVSEKEESVEAYVFKAKDLLEIDDSFIEEIYSLFSNNS